MKHLLVVCAVVLAGVVSAQTIVDVSGVGAKKFTVDINVANATFARCLGRNLELSGLFTVVRGGSIKVSGASGAVHVAGSGKQLTSAAVFGDERGTRMAARRLADAMVSSYSNGEQKGFACDKVLFLNRGKPVVRGGAMPGEICSAYPDGMDIRQHTSDAKMTVYPRWMKDGETILYINDKNGSPQVWQMNTTTGQRKTRYSFKGTTTGIAVSPDGSRVAAILSFQGNPELYVLEGDRYVRLTNTKFASEGQPAWSPDGRKIAYVSDETRTPQIYVIDVATKAKRRLTSKGSQNVDPDWGPDGRITYITKRGGSQIAVMSPAEGDASATLVTEAANWEHPSWSRDGRHLVANRDRALFVIDTLEGGDKPKQMFSANGNWISPCWNR